MCGVCGVGCCVCEKEARATSVEERCAAHLESVVGEGNILALLTSLDFKCLFLANLAEREVQQLHMAGDGRFSLMKLRLGT